MVTRADADTGLGQTSYVPADVLLAVEVVSPDSVQRDRDVKPRKYAAAGIEHYWRVEEDGARARASVFELDPLTRAYAVTGIYHDRLKVSLPFAVGIDLTGVGRR